MSDMESLWGDDFVIAEKEKTKKIIEKIKKPKEVKVTTEKKIKSKSISLSDRLNLITEEVYKVLGKQEENILCVTDLDDLHEYISKAISNGRIDIDTETNNSLDPVTCKLMGACIYTPGEKQVYIPINHRDPETKERLNDQLTEADIKNEFQRIVDAKTLIVMHNGKFDYQVIKCTCGIELPIQSNFWDTLIGSYLLDENEFSHGLKQLYIKYIDPDQEKYSIDHLFEGVEYADVNPKVFALYAAHDAGMTDKLYEWEMEQFKNPDLKDVWNLAMNIEMPLVQVIAEMEMAGMEVDQEYAELLANKYHKKLEHIDAELTKELDSISDKITAWRLSPEANAAQKKKMSEKQYNNAVKGSGFDESMWSFENGSWYKVTKAKVTQLNDPLTANDLGSATQLGILLYDILKCPTVNKDKPYATGEEELKAIFEKTKLSICNLLLERREVVKLISTYIDAIPELAKKWPDGRLRSHFNQYGAATGRLSSGGRIVFGLNDEYGGVNYQNIPSHNREIRMLFKSKDGYKIIGSDYSGQEVRLTAHYSGDENMIKAYAEGRDLYAVIASMSFDKPYEDCLEFYPEGTEIEIEGVKTICGKKTHQNKAGKERRTAAKSVLLGVLYGRGAKSVGEQIGKTTEEAQEIIDKFFKAFPKVKKWINESIESAHEYGYVTDIAGRRRRLPDATLPKYKISFINPEQTSGMFNPFLGCSDRIDTTSNKLLAKYSDKCNKIRFAKEYESIKAEALKEGIEIHSNTGFIAQAERQAVNSRVQGGAASLTKTAMIDIYNDPELRRMGAYLVNTVHDEILIEAPDEYMSEAADRLTWIMVNAAKKLVPSVKMACDPYVTNAWYLDEFCALVQDEFKKLITGDPKNGKIALDPMTAFEKICADRSESTRDQIYELVGKFLPRVPENVNITYRSLTEIE